MKRYILLIFLICLVNVAKTQLNPLFLTIPFLLADINSKTGGMGEIGAVLENLGPRVSYTDGGDKNFLPASLAIGSMVSFSQDISEKINLVFNIAYQAEKLLVPTPPEYYTDSLDANGDEVIREGRKPPSSLPLSRIQSFYDAPGGFKEEWHEILHINL